MERDDIQVETLLLSTHWSGKEMRIRYILARCRGWRWMISRWKRSC
jgi:hypothetical protein